ncbi:MAG: SIR2 family protein, partial [Nitrospira sp.]|nr:SIR2 family protein [Nitrospira sp.]
METALADVGIVPTILSTPDQVHGALPLIHTHCCLFKIHGDYLDTRIRNTPEELAAYPTEFDVLLDRIFDEFGLIVCGWSAGWDEALRKAILRAPSRRFTTYWAAQEKPSGAAQQLIEHRRAEVIPIKDADSFFKSVQQQVQSLEEFSRPHPLSTEAAVASLKRYLTESRYRIQLVDLIGDEIDRVLAATSGSQFAMQGGPTPDSKTATARVRSYEAACSTLLAMAPIGGFWAEDEHYHSWQRALERLSYSTPGGGFTLWLELQRYPGTLLLYGLGLGAVEAGRLQFLARLFTTPVHRENHEDIPAVQLLPPFCLFGNGGQVARFLEGMDRRHAPLNDWLHDLLRKSAERLIPSNHRYTLVFDKLEILMALGFAHYAKRSKDWYWAPPGAFGYRSDNRTQVLQEIDQSISSMGDQSPFVISRIFGDSAEGCTKAITAFREFVSKISGSWY